MPDAQTHRIVACKLLAGQTIPCLVIHPPGPGQILVGNPFVGVEELGLGIIAWLARNSDASTSLHWVMATIQGLIAVGLFMAGKTSMSKNAN